MAAKSAAPALPPAAKKASAPALPPAAAPALPPAAAEAPRDLGPVFEDVGPVFEDDGLPPPEGKTAEDLDEGRSAMADARFIRFLEGVVNNKYEGRADRRPEYRKRLEELQATIADPHALATAKAKALAGIRRVQSRLTAYDRMMRPFSPEDRRTARLHWLNFKLTCRQPNTIEELIGLGFSAEDVEAAKHIDVAASYDICKALQATHKLS